MPTGYTYLQEYLGVADQHHHQWRSNGYHDEEPRIAVVSRTVIATSHCLLVKGVTAPTGNIAYRNDYDLNLT